MISPTNKHEECSIGCKHRIRQENVFVCEASSGMSFKTFREHICVIHVLLAAPNRLKHRRYSKNKIDKAEKSFETPSDEI